MPNPTLGPLERETAEPLHDQISDRIRSRIRSGRWPQHYKLHAEADLATELAVSRGTIRRALKTLIDEGLLRQVQGRGTFVADHRAEQDYSNPLRSMAEDLDRRGISYTTRLVSFRDVVPDQRINGLLDIPVGDTVWQLERVRCDTDANPLMFLRNWVSRERCPGLSEDALQDKSLFRVLEIDFGLELVLSRRTISAVLTSAELSDVLDVPTGSPLLYVEQITYTEGDRPLECSDVWIPPSRMSMSSIVRRE